MTKSKDEEDKTPSSPNSNNTENSPRSIWEAEKAGEGYLIPEHIWFISVVFPLFAGAFGPMASAFVICALTQTWRIVDLTKAKDDMLVGSSVKDPEWLVVLIALSLALCVIANMSLLLSMANRLPFTICLLTAISMYFMSSILLIVSTAITSHTHPAVAGTSFSASFYYACISAGLLLLLCILLTITLLFAKTRTNEIPSDLSAVLTLPQRTLMAQSQGFIIYLLCGAGIFSAIEGWKFTDGIYWATITLLTIGYGDIAPTTHAGRSLIIFYATGGIVMIGLVAGSIGTLVLDRGSRKMFDRRSVNARTKKIREESQKKEVDADKTGDHEHAHHVRVGNEKTEFTLMREVQTEVARSHQLRLIVISTVAIGMLWFLGAAVFWSTEKASQSWSYFNAIYFCFITLLTIGYGDFEVSSEAGKTSFVFWAFLAVPTMTILVASMGAVFLIGVKALIHKIDAFVVLPHESGNKDSYLNKMHKMGKLKMKAKFGHRLGWTEHADGHERHWHPVHGEGARNPDTGVVHHDHRKIHQNLPEDQKLTDDELLFELAREIRELLPRLSSGKNRKYTYEEWSKYIHLLNHDTSKKDHFPMAGWSWFDDESPLFRDKNETEWILERLSARLEQELKRGVRKRHLGKGITEE